MKPRYTRCGDRHPAVEADHSAARETARRLARMSPRTDLENLAHAYLALREDLEAVARGDAEARSRIHAQLTGALELVDAAITLTDREVA